MPGTPYIYYLMIGGVPGYNLLQSKRQACVGSPYFYSSLFSWGDPMPG